MRRIMISPQEALRLILENAPRLGAESAPLAQAVDRTLAAEISSREDLPPFDNSAMDGYAVRSEDCRSAAPEAPVLLEVLETLRAGALARLELGPGQAARIMTGAPIPRGADSVVMKELTIPNGVEVRVLHSPGPGENIRGRGEDVRSGRMLLREGTLLRPQEVALLAAQGITRVPVVRRPRASVLASGDELVPPGEALAPGRIRNSNGPALCAALARWGALASDRGIAPDKPPEMKRALEEALEACDLLLVSGGVSVGDFDYTKDLLEELGLRVLFWKAAIKPGKPLLFGLMGQKPVFGLPGNPVAALLCLEEFVRPSLERMQGHSPGHPSYHLAGLLENDLRKEESRQQYLFCLVSESPEGFRVRVIRPQGSAMLGMACQANALAVAPIGAGSLKKGERIAFRWLK